MEPRLPRLPRLFALVEAGTRHATIAFQRWWQSVVEAIEDALSRADNAQAEAEEAKGQVGVVSGRVNELENAPTLMFQPTAPAPEEHPLIPSKALHAQRADTAAVADRVANALTFGSGLAPEGEAFDGSAPVEITNAAPDQVVTLTGVGCTITGTYPNFTITVP